ncbi:acyltransferase family protein [Aristaeella hokkaidonensis]|uniref:Acyltransferase n=1 Tax=Aristaeella hokkaidonensis TaxID=3046382 RepID=A0AC61MYN6_9FIRM|nr:acyltransferase [Aristaeella hokkaidonensis]QUC68196.1 acyltransferase [Aristaeella hokkaidonensis]SNT95245.1 Peptidoglycan/LPS O-acetylase OafA/YrhL, contains acyltransferase and SGNH-hydrolase domains [Aristaeella hokkaidonensis]
MGECKENKMILSLQAIRAIACLMIFMYHGVGSRFNCGGVWGVSVFFVMSGFVMVYSYWKRPVEPTIKSATTFAIRKIKKLFPLHVIMLIVGLIREILIQHEISVQSEIIKLGITIPLLQTWSSEWYQALNSVDWYLSVTLFLYFIFPFILNAIKKRTPNKKETFLYILCIYTTQIIIGAVFHFFIPNIDIKWIVYCFPLYRLGDFAIGCLVGYLFTFKRDNISLWKKNTSKAEILILPFTILSWAIYYFSDESMKWFSYTCLFLPFSVGLIAIFAKGDGTISRIITNRILLFVASVSSYFFLIHRQVLYYVEYGIKLIFHVENNRLILFITIIVGFALTLLAIKIYQMIEKRLWKKGI